LISFATVLGEKVNYKISTTFMDFFSRNGTEVGRSELKMYRR